MQPLDYRLQVQHAFTRAVNINWIVGAPVLFVGALLCIPMKHYSLDRKVVLQGKKSADQSAEAASPTTTDREDAGTGSGVQTLVHRTESDVDVEKGEPGLAVASTTSDGVQK